MTAAETEKNISIDPAERLIIALDVDEPEKARAIVGELGGLVMTFKIGLQLFIAGGPKFVEELVAGGRRIFLDLKFHDIPNTVAKAGVEAARLGVWMFNVHAAGGSEMMRMTADEVGEFCSKRALTRPLMIGVTVLTSSDVSTLAETGVAVGVGEQVERLARLTEAAGLDGVVASAKEIEIVRGSVEKRNFKIVTPGIRPVNATNDDQKRVMSPGSAVSLGADYLVVGRPIVDSADRVRSTEQILNEIAEAGVKSP